jgi:hypothetical protein
MRRIFHATPPLPEAARRAQRARHGLQGRETHPSREEAPRDTLAGTRGGGGVQRALDAAAAVLADLAGGALTDVVGV